MPKPRAIRRPSAGRRAAITAEPRRRCPAKHLRAESALREAAAQHRQLFDANPHPMWIHELATSRILAVNDAALTHYGYSRAEFLAMTTADLQPSGAASGLHAFINGSPHGSTEASLWRHRRSDGRPIDMEITTRPIAFKGHQACVVLGHDVTEQRRATQGILESREALRALLQRLQRAQEEERTRISREIHDKLGEMLTGLKMDLRWIERKLSEPGLPAALHGTLDRVVAASALNEQTISTVQRLAGELRPGALDQLGLAGALAQRARQFQERHGVICTLQVAEPAPWLSSEVANELFYISQEALTNVARHAQAHRAAMRLDTVEGGARLEIEDDGIGMDAAAAEAPRSLGLLGMRERALHCGGTVQWLATAPHGTRVVVRVPLQPGPP